MALAALLVGGLAAGVVAVYAGDGAGADESVQELVIATAAPAQRTPPPAEALAPPTDAVTPSPSATPSPSLDELRASDAFVEFAEARRARFAPGADRAYDAFGWDGADGHYYRFANASTLWNEVVAPIRDDLLTGWTPYAGVPADILGAETQIQANSYVGTYPRTEGNPQLLALYTLVTDTLGAPALRVHAVLVAINSSDVESGFGHLIGSMHPFTAKSQSGTDWQSELHSAEGKVLAWAESLY